jgi:TonB-like protein
MRIIGMIAILPMLLAASFGTPVQENSDVLPKFVHRVEPVYPMLARQARVQGDVVVQIRTDGESVVEAKAESGPEMLRKASEDSAIAWKFVAHTPGTFHVTFRYSTAAPDVVVVFPESTAIVQVIDVRKMEINIDWAWADLGGWRGQLKSAHGDCLRNFRFLYSGPGDTWLDGSSVSADGRKEAIDYGRKEGNFLIFDMKISQPGVKRVKTFFVGKMAGDKITGTFVDDAGITGEWTAERQRKR